MAEQAHHYVPQTYLRGFLDPIEVKRRQHNLWRYLPGKAPKAKGTKTIAQETDFYDLPEVPPEENDPEEILAKIESNVAPHLAAIREGKLPKNQARMSVALYIGLQWTRTPWFRELANRAVVGFKLQEMREWLETEGAFEALVARRRERGTEIRDVAALRDYFTRVANGEENVIQRNKAWNAKVMLEHAHRLGLQFIEMRWNLVAGEAGYLFITSNNPLYIVDPAAQNMDPSGFKWSKDTEFYLPISPRFMLIGDRKAAPDKTGDAMTSKSVRDYNQIQMQRGDELYASFKSAELRAEFEETIKTRPPLFRELPREYLRAMLEKWAQPRRPVRQWPHGQSPCSGRILPSRDLHQPDRPTGPRQPASLAPSSRGCERPRLTSRQHWGRKAKPSGRARVENRPRQPAIR